MSLLTLLNLEVYNFSLCSFFGLAVGNNMYLPNSLTGTVIREEVGLSLDKAGNEVLGTAAKVVLTKDTTTIVGDGSTQEAVTKRVSQIKNQIEVSLSLSPSPPLHTLKIVCKACDFFETLYMKNK